MATGQDFPSNNPLVDSDGTASMGWLQWFQRVQDVVVAARSSGPTANRPTRLVWVGRFYFDTDLGKPVYFKALGSPNVWVDSAGTSV